MPGISRKRRISLTVLFILSSACSNHFDPVKHPAHHLAFWQSIGLKNLPLEQRAIPAPSLLIDYLRKDNRLQGFSEQPETTLPTSEFMVDLQSAIRELPEAVKKTVGARLYGICFVKNLGGTAFSTSVLSEKDEPVGGFIVLDSSVVNRRANEWITWKENSPFSAEPGYELTAKIESQESDNNRKNAIQFILLHEFGHVIATANSFHPPWTQKPSLEIHPKKYSFSALSWTLNADNHYETLFDDHFRLRNLIQYYRGPETRLRLSAAIEAYESLKKTNFATLYAITTPADDFAEAFATYVHVALMNRPYEIQIKKNGAIIETFSPCWGDPRCDSKKAILQQILGR